MAGESAAWPGRPGGAGCPGALRGPDREAGLQAPGGLGGPVRRPGSSPRAGPLGRVEGRPGRGRGAPWLFAQAWRPLRPPLSTSVIVCGHRCPSLRLSASGRAVRPSGRGRRLHRGDAWLPPRAWPALSEGLLALRRGGWVAGAGVGQLRPRPQELFLAGAFPGGSHPPGTPGKSGPFCAGRPRAGRGGWDLSTGPGPACGRVGLPDLQLRSSGLRLFFCPGCRYCCLVGEGVVAGLAGRPRVGCLGKGVVPLLPGSHCPQILSALPTEAQTKIPGLASPLPAGGERALPTVEAQPVRIRRQRRPQGGVTESCPASAGQTCDLSMPF